MTPLETRAYAKAQGWSDFILGDGGRKVNFYDREAGVLLEGKDPSQNLILIWRKKEEETSMDGITQRMMTRNPCYTSGRTIVPKGIMVHSTATPGVMAEALAKVWDTPTASAAVHAIVDDKATLQTLPWPSGRAPSWPMIRERYENILRRPGTGPWPWRLTCAGRSLWTPCPTSWTTGRATPWALPPITPMWATGSPGTGRAWTTFGRR